MRWREGERDNYIGSRSLAGEALPVQAIGINKDQRYAHVFWVGTFC